MRNAIEWIKSNPVIVAAGSVSLIGILVIAYFWLMSAPGYRADKSEKLKQTQAAQQQYVGVPVPIPDADPNSPPDIFSVVINPTVITNVRDVYRDLTGQYNDIRQVAREKNASNHEPFLLGGGEIWPDANPDEFFSLYISAKRDYLNHFKAAFDYAQPNPWNMPRMVASGPPSPQDIQQRMTQTTFNFVNSIGATGLASLNETQAKQLYDLQRVELMNLLSGRARQINLYVTLPPEEDPFVDASAIDAPKTPANEGLIPAGLSGSSNKKDEGLEGYPFVIADWARDDDAPEPDELWEGQVQLWIMRDIMGTIARFNNVGGTVETLQSDGSIAPERANVVNSPIKRLHLLRTLPGYVGIHTPGGALATADEDNAASLSFNTTGGSNPGQGVYPDPPEGYQPTEPTTRAPEHFGITPTGRVSNSIYDVRHTVLTIDIAWARLPDFVDALRDTNFMTVINADVQDLDEYELLQEGYVYGSGDIVRARLLIESLWFREWTQPYMPLVVKQALGIAPADGEAQPN